MIHSTMQYLDKLKSSTRTTLHYQREKLKYLVCDGANSLPCISNAQYQPLGVTRTKCNSFVYIRQNVQISGRGWKMIAHYHSVMYFRLNDTEPYPENYSQRSGHCRREIGQPV